MCLYDTWIWCKVQVWFKKKNGVYLSKFVCRGLIFMSFCEIERRHLSSFVFDRFHDCFKPLLMNCTCYACQNFTSAYVHHLLSTSEILGSLLLMMWEPNFVSCVFKWILCVCFKCVFVCDFYMCHMIFTWHMWIWWRCDVVVTRVVWILQCRVNLTNSLIWQSVL